MQEGLFLYENHWLRICIPYFKQIMVRLEDAYSRNPPPASLDAAFYSIGLDYSAHLDFLKASGKTNCDSGNFLALLYGQGI